MNAVQIEGWLQRQAKKIGETGARATISCIRPSKDQEKVSYDYVPVIAWGTPAKVLMEAKEGARILVVGKIRTGSYQKQDGTTVYTTDVLADHALKTGEARDQAKDEAAKRNEAGKPANSTADDGFVDTDGADDLPWN